MHASLLTHVTVKWHVLTYFLSVDNWGVRGAFRTQIDFNHSMVIKEKVTLCWAPCRTQGIMSLLSNTQNLE